MSLILRVAVPAPLPQLFDYLPPSHVDPASITVGCRVLVPFGRTRQVAIVMEIVQESRVSHGQLKAALQLLDQAPLLDAEILQSLRLAARYYQYPLGAIVETALPTALRSATPLPEVGERALVLHASGRTGLLSARSRPGARTTALLHLLSDGPRRYGELDRLLPGWRNAAAVLRQRGWIEVQLLAVSPVLPVRIQGPVLNSEQQFAVDTVAAQLGKFAPILLDGVTGSGKTEVYLALIERILARGEQALVLVPEIGLTPQLLRRFRERLACPVHVLHSALGERDRARSWMSAARGEAQVILGTRSAIFTPLPRAGLIVVDEEHDASYKQQEGFRYHGRDLALLRAKALAVPILLGSATPALETLANVDAGRYQHLRLRGRAGAARVPELRVVDLRGKRLIDGLSQELIGAIRACLERGEQALIFKNRRGYAPVLLCHECGWHADCARCDKPLTLHQGAGRLRCHHCGGEQPLMKQCKKCQSTHLQTQGFGTERLEMRLAELFPDFPVVRIDRETTRRKNALEQLLMQLAPDQPGILVGTQMLAKGHDLPNLTLVAIVGADEGLFSTDFRAGERLGQLIVQVSGRAGRALKPGQVWLQTHHPEHPLLQTLMKGGYPALAKQILAERRLTGFPPFAHLALLRAEASTLLRVNDFLTQAAALITPVDKQVSLFGPMPAPMPRRAGQCRGQLLLLAEQRSVLQNLLSAWVERLRETPAFRRVRWSLDVDPQDLY